MKWLIIGFIPLLAAAEENSLVRQFAPVESELPSSEAFLQGETITLVGGTEVVEMEKDGIFEATLQQAFPSMNLKVRSIGWHADTVYRQKRPHFFFTEEGDTRPGSLPDQREKVTPGTLLLFFGKMESLDGLKRLNDFESAYASLVDQLLSVTPRIALVIPTMFEAAGPAASLSEQRNETLGEYIEVIKKLANSKSIRYLNAGPPIPTVSGEMATSNGVHLNEFGRTARAASIVHLLGGEVPDSVSPELLAKVREKSRLWDQYYRPTNWAFLFGDRQHVPSSRGHVDAENRWFVDEVKALEPLITEADTEIHTLAKEVSR